MLDAYGNDVAMGGEPWRPAPVADPAGPPTETWTDPDTAPPDWLYDPTADLSGHPLPPGLRWVFQNGKWETVAMPQAPTATTTPTGGGDIAPIGGDYTPPGGYGGGGPGAGGGGGGAWPSYAAPSYMDPGEFDPGPRFTFRDFAAPTGDTMLQEPGFQFRLDQGRKALEASAAGRGVLRSGGTLKDILGYGQNFASQEYGNVYNRALQEYDTNRGNAADIWGKQYGQRRDVFDTRANTVGQRNTFNLGVSQNDYGARRDAAMNDFNKWKAEGDWLSNPVWVD